ncbi:MAG: PIN domain-containing protein [Lachnospiraceae bacterium]|nr:PIN domain-containing protein [Lachnospiraceae bacterium]MDE6185631.1 PIN domain-containing protein [Lachnospiraceae bacterium]
MRLLIDANILLDVLQKREPHFHDSSLIWKLCETNSAEGYISSLTIANIIYVMRKELDPDKIESVLRQLKLIFQLTDLSVSDITRAAEMKWDDFEDAVQSTIAERIHADCIITRNIRDFRAGRTVAFTPAEYLARI